MILRAAVLLFILGAHAACIYEECSEDSDCHTRGNACVLAPDKVFGCKRAYRVCAYYCRADCDRQPNHSSECSPLCGEMAGSNPPMQACYE